MMTKTILCIDGLGKDLVNEKTTPFLIELGKTESICELKTFFAFTGIEYSFFNSKTPKELGVWLEFVKVKNSIFNNPILRFVSFSKKLRNYVAGVIQLLHKRTWISGLHNIPSEELKEFDCSVKKGLWKGDFFKNKSFVFYKWPFFVINRNGIEKIRLILKYENDEERLKRIMDVKGVDIRYTQLMEIDKAVHKYGKFSNKTLRVIRKIDEVLKKYLSKSEVRKNLLIWSDHGFCDIKNYIDLETILPSTKDYIKFIAGTTASFWFKNERIKQEILRRISKIQNIRILNKQLADKYQIPFDKKYGELIIFLNKGDYFFPNYYQHKSIEKFKAMHGYPDDKELNGFLIKNKQNKNKNSIGEVLNDI